MPAVARTLPQRSTGRIRCQGHSPHYAGDQPGAVPLRGFEPHRRSHRDRLCRVEEKGVLRGRIQLSGAGPPRIEVRGGARVPLTGSGPGGEPGGGRGGMVPGHDTRPPLPILSYRVVPGKRGGTFSAWTAGRCFMKSQQQDRPRLSLGTMPPPPSPHGRAGRSWPPRSARRRTGPGTTPRRRPGPPRRRAGVTAAGPGSRSLRPG